MRRRAVDLWYWYERRLALLAVWIGVTEGIVFDDTDRV